MILSLGLVLLLGFLAGQVLQKIKLPGLVGMILVGLFIGPYCLSLLDGELLSLSPVLRQIALVIILTRSGLNLKIETLKKIGRPALLMCFLPASLEIGAVAVASHYLLSLSWVEGLLLGAVLAAVSPAVVSPRMIRLIEEGYGKKHAVPELVLAGSSADDVFVIVLFYVFLGILEGSGNPALAGALAPLTILSGVVLGVIVGMGIGFLFKRTSFALPVNVLVLLACSFLMLGVETFIKNACGFDVSALLGVVACAMTVLFLTKDKAKELGKGYNALWTAFEILLFVLVGASVNLSYAVQAGGFALLVLLVGLVFRSFGVLLCLVKTPLTAKERLFAMLAYLPKATVQASIGGIALGMGLPCGEIVLAVSVLAILITAPLGAILIDTLGRKLLKKEEESTSGGEIII